jgi:HlyD family secretion protein
MKKVLLKVRGWVVAHKIISVVIAVVIMSGGYYTYTKIHAASAATQYVLGRVTRGDLVVSVSGTGQVATLSAVDIKPKTTGQSQTLGQIISVNVKNGDTVKAGQVVAVLDGKAALQSYNQAKASVASAQANYNKLVNGATATDLQSLNSSVQNAQTTLSNTKQSILTKLQTDYTSAANAVYLNTDPFFNNPLSVSKLQVSDVLFTNQQLQASVEGNRPMIGTILENWKQEVNSATLTSDLPTLVNNGINNLRKIRTYFDDMTSLFGSYAISSTASGQSSINSNKSTASSARSSIDTAINDLITVLQTYQNAQTSLQQAQASLSLKQAPPSKDDVTVAKAQLDNANANLATAYETYASRIITAPFAGQIGGLTAQVGQQVSSSDSLGKIITSQKVVNISLNEVDAAKIKANDSVALTFDALPNVTIKGHVNYVDPLGTVTQGVVSYAVQIAMDEQNDQIKTGMTASAAITTESHPNVVMVPTSAITKVGNRSVVLVPNQTVGGAQATSTFGAPSTSTRTRGGQASSTINRTFQNQTAQQANLTVHPVTVTTGISNDTETEILSGLNPGDQIVVRTVSGTKTTTTTTGAGGLFGGAGANRTFVGGGAVRATTGR